MKKQKFEVYAQPLWKNIVVPPRTQNQSKLSTKSRKRVLKRGISLNKNPSDIKGKESLHQFPCIRLSEDDDPRLWLRKDVIVQIDPPKNDFIIKNRNISIQNKSLKKVNQSQDNNIKPYQPYEKRTISTNIKQRSLNKFNGSVTWTKKQFREIKLKNLSGSPYLKTVSDLSKIVKMLQPVKGPNESIRKQIIQYNESHKKNHELVVMRRQYQTFEMKRQVYLQRIGLQPKSKVFVMNSRDYHIREALIKRGWVELNDISDNFFHLKWVYSDNSNDYSNLNQCIDGQLFNHFHNNQQLTNKNNLRKNIKAALKQDQPLIPLTFDLGIGAQFKKFIEISTLFEGIKILNAIINCMKQSQPNTYKRIISNSNNFKFFNIKETLLSKKSNISILDLIQYQEQQKQTQKIIRNTIQLITYLAKSLKEETSIEYSLFLYEKRPQKKDNILMIFKYFENIISQRNNFKKLPSFLKVQLCKIQFHYQQEKMTYKKCYGTQNSWIIKPTGVSRGTGIYIESDFKNIFSQQNNQHGKIVQKYIQRPFLLNDHRKFDLRQWVLVKSFQPFQVYIYDKLYGRICPQKYVEKDFDNNQIHLTNYSLSKEFYKSKNSNLSDNQDIERSSVLFNRVNLKKSSMASIILEKDLIQQIQTKNSAPKKTWQQIKLQIKSNIIKTIKCCSSNIEQNPNCFEVYGFDILLDQDLNVFVIEVNLSPACERRQGLQVYLQQMSQGLVDHVEKWINLSDKISIKQIEQNKHCWQRLNQKQIQNQLRQINEQKIRTQKAIIIQKWFRKYLKTN